MVQKQSLTRPATVDAILAAAAMQWPDRPFIVFEEMSWNFQEVDVLADRVARGLIALGVRSGDRVALWMSNRPEWVMAQFGASRMGAVLVPVNTRLRHDDLAHTLRDAGARVVVTQGDTEEFSYRQVIESVRDDCPSLERIVLAGDGGPADGAFLSWDTFLAQGDNVPGAPEPETDLDAMAYILYTSGTTGLPKGVMLSHRNLNNAFNLAGQMGDAEVFFMGYPLFTITGCHNTILASAIAGTTVVLQERFEAGAAIDLIERHRCTLFGGHLTVVEQVIKHPAFTPQRVASLRGGRIFPRRPHNIPTLKALGVDYAASGYGLTETSGPLVNNIGIDEKTLSTEGHPWPGVEIDIRDEHGKPVPTGEQGIIHGRSPQVMLGYFNNPEATAKTLIGDGWIKTGDLGRLDEDGNLSFISRYDDVFKCAGFNVAEEEVEIFLSAHPDIEHVAVAGVSDAAKGQVGAAFVIPKAGRSVDLDDLRAFCADRVASYKVPGHVIQLTEFPRTAMGKVQKVVLKRTHFPEG